MKKASNEASKATFIYLIMFLKLKRVSDKNFNSIGYHSMEIEMLINRNDSRFIIMKPGPCDQAVYI